MGDETIYVSQKSDLHDRLLFPTTTTSFSSSETDKPQAPSDDHQKYSRIASAAQAAVEQLASAGYQPTSNKSTATIPPGFQYDASSGYYSFPHHHTNNNPITYYDAATNTYFHEQLQEWGYINHNTEEESPNREFISLSGHRELLLTEFEEEEDDEDVDMEERGEKEEQRQQQGKRGAVIGAGPKLNAEGLLEAARQEDLKIQSRQEKRRKKVVVGVVHKGSGWVSKRREARALA